MLAASRKRLYNGPLESYVDEAISFAACIEAALRPIIQDMGRQGYSWRDIELFVVDEARDVAADEIIQMIKELDMNEAPLPPPSLPTRDIRETPPGLLNNIVELFKRR